MIFVLVNLIKLVNHHSFAFETKVVAVCSCVCPYFLRLQSVDSAVYLYDFLTSKTRC